MIGPFVTVEVVDEPNEENDVARRSWKIVVLGAAASLGLAACSIPVALSDTTATLGSSTFLQIHLKADLNAAAPGQAKLVKALRALTFDINEESATSTPIASSLNDVKQELVVMDGPTQVLTLVDVHSNLYLEVNISSLGHIPGLGISPTALASINLIFGDRWFEFPYSLLSKYASKSLHVTLKRSGVASTEILLENALVSFFAQQSTTTVTNGFTQSGSLASLESVLTPILEKMGTSPLKTVPHAGSYHLAVTTSGSLARSATLSLTTPNGKYGTATFSLKATFARQELKVDAPQNPLVITSTFLKQLGSLTNIGTNGGGVVGTTITQAFGVGVTKSATTTTTTRG